MNLQTAVELYNKLEQESYSQNLFARANSRYILFGVNEIRDNFPPTLESNLNFGCDSLAFSYLSIGCCMFEKNYQEKNKDGKEIRRLCIEKGAELIEYNHFYEQNQNELSPYYLLIGALSYYAASQYSKAFVVMKKVNNIYQTDISVLTSAFLRKDFKIVSITLNKILLNENYIRQTEEQNIDSLIHVVLYARAFANLMDFLYFGNQESLSNTKDILNDLLELLGIEKEPSLWWIVRLLIIIVNGLEESSLWATIPPNIPENIDLTSKFINNLIFAKNPTIELFVVQRKALANVLSEKGAVVSLPTSSGKTRIAEIAILQCLSQYPAAKILYLAPFRSLAYEIENTMKQTFEKIGFLVSQLYGSGQFSQIDKVIIEEANILIATPEKAKVILRANDEVTEQIKLVIIDEGHLLDIQERQVRNEMFIEELKKYVQNNNGKIILLSAVLPNVNEISEWITQSNTSWVSDNERVSRQRLGILEFRNNKVSIEWQGDEKSYNPNFIIPFKPKGKQKLRPSSKEEGVAYSALKLSVENPLLIFIANASSVYTYAKALIEAMNLTSRLVEHKWKNHYDWETFQLICFENDSNENKELLEYAKYGILCHKRNINNDLKNIIERLMRNDKPKIIIATMTLGQGVNLGISTIIFAGINYYNVNSKKPNKWENLENKDFWNVAGRVGRSFIDTEGKILFATENSAENKIALDYFQNQPQNTYSGLLGQIMHIKTIASTCGVDFEQLLEIISENDFNVFSSRQYNFKDISVSNEFQDFFDWIDDALLSLEIQFDKELLGSIDDYFRHTLAYIQSENYEGLSQDDVIKFLKARCDAIKNKIVPDRNNWGHLVSSGLPLSSAIRLDSVFAEIQILADAYLISYQKIEDKINLLKGIELIMKTMPSNVFKNVEFSDVDIEAVRNIWLIGEPLNQTKDVGNTQKICNNYFSYTLSWFLGAVANRFRKFDLNDQANIFEELAVCCELGLPDFMSAKIYLAGIHSRLAAKEISTTSTFINITTNFVDFDIDFDITIDLDLLVASSEKENNSNSITGIKQKIFHNIQVIKSEIKHEITRKWLDVFEKTHLEIKQEKEEKLPEITINGNVKATRLFIREFSNQYYACSPDYLERIAIQNIDNSLEGYINSQNVFLELEGEKWNFKKT